MVDKHIHSGWLLKRKRNWKSVYPLKKHWFELLRDEKHGAQLVWSPNKPAEDQSRQDWVRQSKKIVLDKTTRDVERDVIPTDIIIYYNDETRSNKETYMHLRADDFKSATEWLTNLNSVCKPMKELVIAKTDGTLLKRPKAEKKGHGYLEMERELEEFRRKRDEMDHFRQDYKRTKTENINLKEEVEKLKYKLEFMVKYVAVCKGDMKRMDQERKEFENQFMDWKSKMEQEKMEWLAKVENIAADGDMVRPIY
ncbi:hypothetical protein AAMO2058_000522800 [Amorphochlora amoebiformis]|uniref:PH domain-containing protein n=1 Tax=Amorphochlora amoebiformis TaxID=1561963 RepID=A0A7S0DSH6_9EUKA|mmetsp:Transcript_4849/g.7402  ORF Transcript_4849/g.7402 Transcript_4849/m.7402 type:complete len:253 (+) Transcript_4849:60-818(+)